jgi:HK97 family phage prohead protease
MSKHNLPEGRELLQMSASVELEYRTAEGGVEVPAAIVGQAVVCNVRSVELGPREFRFVEIIDPTALDGADMSEVEGVFNHNPDILLGHTRSQTMTLARSADGGLTYHIPYDSEDPDHQRVARKIKRGEVSGSSFVFKVKPGTDQWSEERNDGGDKVRVRRVMQIAKLYDVCPVTNPAYPDSSAAKRSHDAYAQTHPEQPTGTPTDLLEQELALKSRR